MDTTKDTTMQHVTDVSIVPEVTAEFIAGLLERIEQLESDLATAEQDSRQKQARIDRLEEEEKERDNYKFALSAYVGKTEWVQLGINDGTVSPKYLGWHRADVMTDLLEAAERKAEMLHQLLDAHRKDHAVIQEQNSRLRAEIEVMKQQEPVKYEIRRKPRQDNTWSLWKQTYKGNIDRMPNLGVCSDALFDYEVRALYLAPGAQPAPSAAAIVEACAKACERLTKPSGPVPGHPIDAWLLATLDCAKVIRALGSAALEK